MIPVTTPETLTNPTKHCVYSYRVFALPTFLADYKNVKADRQSDNKQRSHCLKQFKIRQTIGNLHNKLQESLRSSVYHEDKVDEEIVNSLIP